MGTVIRGGRIIDPARGLDATGDLFIEGALIADRNVPSQPHAVIPAEGLWVVPGLIDAHVHLREPGGERKETIATGLAAAAAGGFTAVLAMPNTTPANDSPALTRMMIDKAEALGGTRLFPVAAATLGRRGTELSPFAELAAAGAVAFSDDGSAVVSDDLMAKALATCAALGVPFAQHAEDPALSLGGVLHDGPVARDLEVPGWPVEAEVRIVARDIALAERTGAMLHVSHVSTREAIDHIRAAKRRSVRVSAEVTPHHLHLTDAAAEQVGTLAKVNPPLRPADHVEALRHALADGTLDLIATDHAPHADVDKDGGFAGAAFGVIGLETAVPLGLLLVAEGVLTPLRLVEALSTAPARVFRLPGGTLAPGGVADVTLIDPARPHVIDPNGFRSKSRNTPFAGWRVPGRVVRTIVGGRTIFLLEGD